MDLELTGNATLVTASDRGLGKAAATALVREGVDVASNGRNEPTLEALNRGTRKLPISPRCRSAAGRLLPPLYRIEEFPFGRNRVSTRSQHQNSERRHEDSRIERVDLGGRHRNEHDRSHQCRPETASDTEHDEGGGGQFDHTDKRNQ